MYDVLFSKNAHIAINQWAAEPSQVTLFLEYVFLMNFVESLSPYLF